MREPYRTEFAELIRCGAAGQDIHDSCEPQPRVATKVGEDFVDRELKRVSAHQLALCPLIEHFVGCSEKILDAGCSTGGATLALALSRVLLPREVHGVDPNQQSIKAADVRAAGYAPLPCVVQFHHIDPGKPLPFPDGYFDLTVSVSVMEFVTSEKGRHFYTSELKRVTRPRGYIYLSIPSPFRLREAHSKVVFGDIRRPRGKSWSSPPWSVRQMFNDCKSIPIAGENLRQVLARRGLKVPGILPLAPWVAPLLKWQKFLFRK